MELGEFIQRTVEQIVCGVKSSHTKVKEVGGKVGCSMSHTNVEFDVAVTTVEHGSQSREAGIFVSVIGAGAKGKAETTNTSVSRVKFVVDVELPASAKFDDSPISFG